MTALAVLLIAVPVGFLLGRAWQARVSRRHARAQTAFLRGGWRA